MSDETKSERDVGEYDSSQFAEDAPESARVPVVEAKGLEGRVRGIADRLRRKGEDETSCDDFHRGYKFCCRGVASELEAALAATPPPAQVPAVEPGAVLTDAERVGKLILAMPPGNILVHLETPEHKDGKVLPFLVERQEAGVWYRGTDALSALAFAARENEWIEATTTTGGGGEKGAGE